MPTFRLLITNPIHWPMLSCPTVSATRANPTVYTTAAERPCRKRLRTSIQIFLARYKRAVAAALPKKPRSRGERLDELLSAKWPIMAARGVSLQVELEEPSNLREKKNWAAPNETRRAEFQYCTNDRSTTCIQLAKYAYLHHWELQIESSVSMERRG